MTDLLYKLLVDPFVQMGTAPDLLVQTLWEGLVSGVFYALIALTFVLIFKASGIINLAQGSLIVFAALTLIALYENGVPAFLALILTVVVMLALVVLVERLMLEPLVNPSYIEMITATLPVMFVLMGLSEIIFGGDPKVMIADHLYLPRGAIDVEMLGGFVSLQKIDVAAGVIASLMVAGLVFVFQKTRIGRALRAVAEGRNRALSVGVSLEQVRITVWLAAGMVALATGIMWGARSNVSFALEIIALKALPVLILGGLTSIPGAIAGGLIIGVGEKLGEFYWGPLLGNGIESWFGYVFALVFVAIRPVGLFAGRVVHEIDKYAELSSQPSLQMKSYAAEPKSFPLLSNYTSTVVILAIGFFLIPAHATSFTLNSVLIPILIMSVAAIGLDLLIGFAGLLSLGTAGFMGVGAYTCYKLTITFPDISIIIMILGSGITAALAGILFGWPVLRLGRPYFALATIGAQLFLSWCFFRLPWLSDYGTISVPVRTVLGFPITGSEASASTRYLVVLAIAVLMAWVAYNLISSKIGRLWLVLRQVDVTAESLDIKLYHAKLFAVAVSSFYCGVAGALMVFLWLGAAEGELFNINQSFIILFMVLIGGVGSLIGSFVGATFIWMLPIVLRWSLLESGLSLHPATVEHLTLAIVGILVFVVQIVEPGGLARVWQNALQRYGVIFSTLRP